MLFSVLWYAIFILGLQRLILFHTAIGIVVRCSVCDVNLMKHILHFLDVLVFSFHCVVSFVGNSVLYYLILLLVTFH